MILNIKPGIENEVTRQVTENDIASAFGIENMPVLTTSRIVAFMEYVALSSVQNSLPDGYSTVGIEISLYHIKPVVLGAMVSCSSRLTKVNGRKLYFEIVLRNICEVVAKATHTRSIINNKAFERILGEEKC